jgi:hypothetical protein
MNDTTDHSRIDDLAHRVRWLEHDSLSPYQILLLLILQTVLPAYGALTLITSAALWVLAGPSQALANVQLFVDLAVATVMGLSLLVWLLLRVTDLIDRIRGDSPLDR